METTSRIVTPYSGVHETGDNQTACKHFFRCVNSSSFVDEITGIVWPYAGLSYNSTLGSYSTDMSASSTPVLTTGGNFHTFTGTKASFFIASCRVTTGTQLRLAIGDTNSVLSGTNGSGVGLVANHSAMSDIGHVAALTNTAAFPDPYIGDGSSSSVDVDGDDIFIAASYEAGSGISHFVAFNSQTGTAIIENDSADNTGDLTLSDFMPFNCIRFSGIELYGYAAFEFSNGLPSDWLTASKWMSINWKNGDRYLYPRWNSLT